MAEDDISEVSIMEDTEAHRLRFAEFTVEDDTVSKKQFCPPTLNKDSFKILDPNDPLMNRFQHALKTHLLRIDNKLSEEISELESAIKDANKSRENEGIYLYEVQQEAVRQETAIENYKDMLAEITNLRGDLEERLKVIKENYKQIHENLEAKKLKEKKLLQSIESLDALQQHFSKWKGEVASNLEISQRISEKDAAIERELLSRKQQKDYILYRLEDEVWKLQNEIKDLDEQLQIKNEEKLVLSQSISDANADLNGLEKEQKTLYNAWNSVLNLISQRDKINEEINAEQRKIRESLQNLETQAEKLKKDSAKEMENNENLTSLQSRLNEEIKYIRKLYNTDKEKYLNLETNFIKVSKILNQTEMELSTATMEYDTILSEEEMLNKNKNKIDKMKRDLEDKILIKLDDKVTHDKQALYLNKLLHEAKDFNLENELSLSKLENSYGKSLLELEKLYYIIENEKFDLDAIMKKNVEKEIENHKLQDETRNCESLIKQKTSKIQIINKKIEEILSTSNRETEDPLDSKILYLEQNIDETELNIKNAQQSWLRQQNHIFTLSKQRDELLQDLTVVGKEVLLMEQRNIKLEIELEKQNKEEINMDKIMNSLQQKLIQMNARLASQKELKNELEDKNNVAKTEYIKSLKDSEMELIKLQNDIKKLIYDKDSLKDDLKFAQQESLSWEKKVQLINETYKNYKEETSSGGDIALMKNEIHKMEMRLSYLRKAQEKLVQDMENSVARRDVIVDEALSREKINPKSRHNQRIVFRKRLDDQKTKIKQIIKETNRVENKIETIEIDQKNLIEYLNEGQKLLRQNEDIIPDLEKQIKEAELIKNHNLEVLVRKQRKVNMLQDLKSGRYRLLIKNEMALTEEWQNQKNINNHLKDIMEQTKHDFPLLESQTKKILLTLQNS